MVDLILELQAQELILKENTRPITPASVENSNQVLLIVKSLLKAGWKGRSPMAYSTKVVDSKGSPTCVGLNQHESTTNQG